MKEYKCTNCGATINPVTGICPYCRSRFDVRDDNLIRIETYHNPIKVYQSAMEVPSDVLAKENSEEFSAHIIRQLARNMTDSIAENLEIEAHYVPERMSQRFNARIRIVEPKYMF